VDAVKKEMQAIFEAAGQKLVFNDPGAAVGTYNGTYSLTISARLPDVLEQLNADPTYSGLVGITMGKTFMSDASYAFSDEKGHMINRGIVSTYWTGKYVPEGTTFSAYLGQMGAHEAGHWFLKQLFGTGHARDKSLMGEGVPGSRFSKKQAAALSKLCK